MRPIGVATPEDHIALVMSRCGWQPGDVIQPMSDGERRTMRVLQRIEGDGAWHLPRYIAVDKHGAVHDVWMSDDPRPGNLADAEEE
jgi:hypothetical protein